MNDIKINSEVLGVLKILDKETLHRLPDDVYEYLVKNSKEDLIPDIPYGTPLNEMPISREAQAFVTMLNLAFFCKDGKEKETIMKRIIQNEKKYNS